MTGPVFYSFTMAVATVNSKEDDSFSGLIFFFFFFSAFVHRMLKLTQDAFVTVVAGYAKNKLMKAIIRLSDK